MGDISQAEKIIYTQSPSRQNLEGWVTKDPGLGIDVRSSQIQPEDER